MRILILHNAYQRAGGEDQVVANEAELLARAGHDVRVEIVDNAEIDSLATKLKALWRVPFDPDREGWMADLLASFEPDVVHVHNFFPLLTPAVHQTASRHGTPVIQTLHNFRLFCAAATFERDGRICELCLHGSRLNAVRYRCYRGSLPGSVALVRMQEAIERRGLLTDNVDTFIALTEFARSKFIEGGLPGEKIVVKPNFVDRPLAPDPATARSGALFVGRISAEKGVGILIDAWRELPDIPLTIAGDGPMRAQLEAGAPSNVRFLGHVDKGAVEDEMRKASALIAPSVWYEGFPMILVEAFANGLPVIASRVGSLAEIVRPGQTGELCEPNDAASLRSAVAQAFSDPESLSELGRSARRIFEERYSAAPNLAQMEKIYAAAMRRRN